MKSISKQFLTDDQGHPIGVVIPYEEWLRIEQHLDKADHASPTLIQQYAGIIRLTEDPIIYQRRMRDEWA
ncbi:MAG: hypothetical protein KC643_28965 [Nitrospira sp.]|nr:hypothetical protein [Nitrospira sp.]MCA9481265.1 hypothetical protein [Nitrospira sp.]MDR4488164.1 hypothetical protein [Nitrospirales bacterium]